MTTVEKDLIELSEWFDTMEFRSSQVTTLQRQIAKLVDIIINLEFRISQLEP